jgi:hypothetical protein
MPEHEASLTRKPDERAPKPTVAHDMQMVPKFAEKSPMAQLVRLLL